MKSRLGVDEVEDSLELEDPAVRDQIAKSNADVAASRTLQASELLDELRQIKVVKPKRSTK